MWIGAGVVAGITLATLGCGGDDGSTGNGLLSATEEATTSTTDFPWTVPSPTPTAVAPVSTPEPQPPATFAVAQRLRREGSLAAARAAYTALAVSSVESSRRAEALLGLGVTLYDAGDGTGAVNALREAVATAPAGSTSGRQAAYLLGVRLNEAAGFAEAAGVLAPFASPGRNDALQPYLLAEYASAAARSNQYAAAISAWEELLANPAAPSSLKARIYRDWAIAAGQVGDQPARRRYLAEYASRSGSPEARFELAMAARDAGDYDTLAVQLSRLIDSSPSSRLAIPALEALYAAGIAVDTGQAGFVYYRRGQYTRARDTLAAAVGEDVPAADLAFRTYYLAAAREALGDYASAIATYDRVPALSPTSPWAHQAQWWAARLTEDTGNPAAAANRYHALVQGGPAGDFSVEAAFRAGYTLLSAGRPGAAIETWNALGVATDPRLLYWKGRTYASLGDPGAATAAYRAAIAADPLSFHGIEAARQLGESSLAAASYRKVETLAEPDWEVLSAWLQGIIPGTPPTATDTGVAADFLKVGLRKEATALLLGAASNGDAWTLFGLMRQGYELGLVDVSSRLAVRLRWKTELGDTQIPVDLLRLEYPLDYVVLLDEVSSRNGLDPLFLAALIRQESFWDPSAGSHAGALGLTQVIPPTGEAIAEALGVEGFDPSDLFRPAVSLRFGAHYIGGQLRRYGNPYQALAAYNAGPGNASRWGANSGGAIGADFVEAVDISETYHYVIYVLEHYARYQRAYRG